MRVYEKNTKFRVRSDLALFEAIQKNGRLSEMRIAEITHISPTTVHYAMARIRERDFFRIRAVPCLEKFPDIPKAVMGFSNVHPLKVQGLREKYANMAEVEQFFYAEKDVILFIVDSSMERLTKRLYEIMEFVQEKPCIYMVSPSIAKCECGIPDKVLEAVYADLPDRKTRKSVKV